MRPVHDRSNGLGGGFAGYGIYPEYRDFYALHVFFNNPACRTECEAYLKDRVEIVKQESIHVRKTHGITDAPLIRRYFVAPMPYELLASQLDEKEFIARIVMKINSEIRELSVFSAVKIWSIKAVATRRMWAAFTLRNIRPMLDGARPLPTNIRWWGGAHLALLTIRVLTERYFL
jgi:glutamate synthase domain-containing protein 1